MHSWLRLVRNFNGHIHSFMLIQCIARRYNMPNLYIFAILNQICPLSINVSLFLLSLLLSGRLDTYTKTRTTSQRYHIVIAAALAVTSYACLFGLSIFGGLRVDSIYQATEVSSLLMGLFLVRMTMMIPYLLPLNHRISHSALVSFTGGPFISGLMLSSRTIAEFLSMAFDPSKHASYAIRLLAGDSLLLLLPIEVIFAMFTFADQMGVETPANDEKNTVC